jgi:RHS repeat-associated protein
MTSDQCFGYRFGFNGMERDDEVKGQGNSYDFGARIYDSRLGRWMSTDPLAGKFSYESPYTFVSNNPVIYLDPTGKSKWITHRVVNEQTGETTEISVLNDKVLLKAVPDRTTSSLSPHTLGPIHYDYYDINEVHTTVIKKDGTKIIEPVKTERGDYRAHTIYKSNYWANVFKDENEFEENEDIEMTGIRWTTSKTNAEGQGNSFESGRTFSRSENIDMLLSLIDGGKSMSSAIEKSIKTLDRVRKVAEAVDKGSDVIDGLSDKTNKDSMVCRNCQETISTKTFKDSRGSNHLTQ